jgi:hypothetical protein
MSASGCRTKQTFNQPMNPGIDVMCQKQTACLARYLDDGRVIGRTSRI